MIYDFEKLVGRHVKQIPLLESDIEFFNRKRVAITGGAGSIGSALASLLLKETNAFIALIDADESRLHTTFINLSPEHQERTQTHLADIRDFLSINHVIERSEFDLVIHAAALKHVSVLEKHPREAFLTNVLGTRNLLQSIIHSSVKHFVFISTDKAANPVSILGKSKLIGEMLVAGVAKQNVHLEMNIVRFGNVFLSRGSVLETFASQIEKGLPVSITSPSMERFFIDLEEACALILKSSASNSNVVSILKMGDPINILELASKFCELNSVPFSYKVIGKFNGEKYSESLFSDFETLSLNDYQDYTTSNFSLFLRLDEIGKQIVLNDESAKLVLDQLLDSARNF